METRSRGSVRPPTTPTSGPSFVMKKAVGQMSWKQFWKSTCATVALGWGGVLRAGAARLRVVVRGAMSTPAAQAYAIDPASEPHLSHAEKLALIKQNIKYVFVIYQENRAFDFEFGTFPGVDGLFNQPSSQILGFKQKIVNTDGSVGTISPFLIPQTVTASNGKTVPLYPADTASTDHSQVGYNVALDIASNLNAANDRYSRSTGLPPTSNPTLAQKQMAELDMSHVDCDTIPFLWQYADRFALFDAFHQTVIGPSTPNAIAMIAGQSGLTQWALHPNVSTANPATASSGVPMVNDSGPFPGSNLDTSPIKPPYNPGDSSPKTPHVNQTYASLPLSFMGRKINTTIASDQNPTMDLADVQDDITLIAGENLPPTNWAWYELGFANEPGDPTSTVPGNPHNDFIVHHEGPQYFGYIADNAKVAQQHLFGQGRFYHDIEQGKLSPTGGVFYIRGGYGNIDGLKPVDPNPTVQADFTGNDDHPGYSDTQISEASVADTVNAIAHSKYWKNSAIIITYDETDGLYDHQALAIRALDPEGNPVEQGPRIPALVISPYGRAHVIVHQKSEHGSVIKFIDELFSLTPLADLPDEELGQIEGYFNLGQPYLSPSDDNVPGVGDLFPAFDNERLLGVAKPIPADYAEINPFIVHALPHYAPIGGCKALEITPTDYRGKRVIDPAPADFNPRPGTNPGIPTSGTWTP